jgi:site-specific DNA-cytosine methylase
MDGAERPDNAHAEAGWLVADDTATALTTRCGSTLDDQQIGQLVAEGKQRSFTENGHGMKYAEDDGVTGPLRTTDYKRPESHIVVSEPDTFVKTHRAVDDADAEHWNPDDTAPTLNVADNTGDVRATVLAVDTDDELYFDGGSQSDRIYDADGVSPSLNAKSSPGSSYDTPTIAAQTDSFDSAYGGNSSVFSDGTTPPVKVGTGLGIPSPPAVAYPVARRGRDDEAEWEIGEEGTYNSLRAGDGSSSRQPAVLHDQPTLAVRRLTPRECERLMSWPDDWTRWNDQGDEIADSVRYRMCGNGVVSNVAEWIARRLPQ